ncbi:MAG: hypothetical protein CSB34_00645 [Desulfobulbus propionicus]|nr:MAG: hypothetical protein CSB34_00645 [Desulfobulbus propionicus]
MSESKKDHQLELEEIKLLVPPHLYRAFQRCVWIQINQTGKTQLEVMEEVVLDFLNKHQC